MVEKIRLYKKKGISSVVGAFFFLILMFAVFGAIITAFQFQSDLVNTNMAISDTQTKKIQERFTVTPEAAGGSLTKVTIDNQSPNPIEVVDLWVIEESGSFGATRYTPSDPFVPAGAKTNIVANQSPAIGVGGGTYKIKAVTALGTRATSQLVGGSSTLNPDSLVDKLVAKPAVYAAFPNPMTQGGIQAGVDHGRGYFGLIIANPTPHDMLVYQSSFQLITPGNPAYFDSSAVVTASPSGWSRESATTLKWTDATPLTVNKYSVKELKATIETSNSITESLINTVNTNTYSSLGQFGSTKIDTTGSLTIRCAVPNVMQSTTLGGGEQTYIVKGVTKNADRTYYVTLKNTGGQGTIKAGSTLVINIPKAFTNIIPQNNDLTWELVDSIGASTTLPLTMQDGSTQIRAKLKAGADITASSFKTYSFSARSPDVTSTTLYVFYMYAVGTVNCSGTTDKIMGPVAETVVQVCKDTGDASTCS